MRLTSMLIGKKGEQAERAAILRFEEREYAKSRNPCRSQAKSGITRTRQPSPMLNTIREKWPWNGEFLRLFLVAPSAIGIAATMATVQTYGKYSLGFLLAIPIGLLLYGIYASVGRRVVTLKEQYRDANGDLAESLMAIGKMHSPGIVIFGKSQIEFVPIVGEVVCIENPAETLVGEGRWLPGKYLWGKRVFTFRSEMRNPLAFAVAESVGARWSSALKRGEGVVVEPHIRIHE